MTEFKIRPAEASDLSFIYDTFLNSLRYDTEMGKNCKNSIFFPEYHKIVDSILLRSTTKIACHQNEPSVIFGYLIYEPNILHYCFVKHSFQRFGIAKTLFLDSFGGDGSVYITHLTRIADPIIKKYTNLVFNPFKLYKGEDNERSKDETKG